MLSLQAGVIVDNCRLLKSVMPFYIEKYSLYCGTILPDSSCKQYIFVTYLGYVAFFRKITLLVIIVEKIINSPCKIT